MFLTLDHIDDDGAAHRRAIGGSSKLQWWLEKNGYPEGMFRILCFNCNTGRYINGGRCPHEEERDGD